LFFTNSNHQAAPIMRGNSFGHNLVMTSFGESHGPAIGVVIDGCPAGLEISEARIAEALQRRRPGQSPFVSARNEPDLPEVLSGILGGFSLGTPIAVVVRNQDARSEEYKVDRIRPGHADAVWTQKFGIRDRRGGGRSSGRETIARVIGGGIAECILPKTTTIVGHTIQIGSIRAKPPDTALTRAQVDKFATRCPDPDAALQMEQAIDAARSEGDSLGGIAEILVDGLPAGLGDPVFHKLKSDLTAALMSVGAVVGVTLGDAGREIEYRGRLFHALPDFQAFTETTHGFSGGISNGDRIGIRVYIKPPSTIGHQALEGRHDPCLLPRSIPVLEAMTAFTLADHYLTSRLDRFDDRGGSAQ
jgi:chorismate synthase